ncbi:fungal specific transcription factor [Grosmannia clavigera kw1407]|uniref:Fungal specific transcription factor n=1 Tax=Grosmannia clavigera (strain kw1407 / UAMH 11150) TaxID=655863 RepID=F0XF55_GROCL|nr:fungal specific transcription factor [Grosmannia clavigera kw1407]EFX03619.1 fungal specific transcription factor [Grosmannia clavigera kw1407]
MFSSFYSQPPLPASTPRSRTARRAQVRRACHFCRLTRAKCDSQLPCHNCQHKGRICMITASDRRGRASQVVQTHTPKTGLIVEVAGTTGQLSPTAPLVPLTPLWKGLRVGDVYYGPSSMTYFRNRLYAFPNTILRRQQPDVASHLRSLCRPSATLAGLPPPEMPHAQEDLDLWWLWQQRLPHTLRLSCGLLGAQYLDNCGLPSSAHSHVAAALRTAVSLGMHCSYVSVAVDQDDVSYSATELLQVLAGRLWASLTAMDADLSVRLGHPMLVLGLGLGLGMVTSMGWDQDTVLLCRPTSSPRLARLLGAIYVMSPAVEDETKDDDDDGRQNSQNRQEDLGWECLGGLEAQEGLEGESPHSTTWLTYHDQCTRLIHLVGTNHADFYRHCEHLFRQHVASVTSSSSSSSLHTDPNIREAAARFLVSRTSALYAWAGAVPYRLQTPRSRLPDHDRARPFDTTSTASPLDLCPHRDPATPL